MTALMQACAGGFAEIVEFLLARNALPWAYDSKKLNSLMHATKNKHVNIIRLILNSKTTTKNYWNEPITTINDSPDLLNHNTDMNHNTAFTLACEAGDIACARLLLDSGAWPDEFNTFGLTPIMIASKAGRLDLVRLILTHPNTRNFSMIINPDERVLDGIGRGFEFQHQLNTDRRNTPLMWASKGGHLPVVEYLVSMGADKNACNLAGLTARELARQAGHNAVVKYLDTEPEFDIIPYL